ncbi:MAG: acyl-CoA thioesterase [Treponema sp.]|nr:MAG: acyl-CoA thioesterase [Treponema sp.]
MTNLEKNAYIINETVISAEFFDVDAMNVVWHGNYVKYMEVARCALLDKIGYGYKEMVKEGFAYPVTSVNLKYVRSLCFGDKATVKTYLVEYEKLHKN